MAGPSGPAFLYNFYPRSPCGERLLAQSSSYNAYMISIHALLAESDCLGLLGWLRVLISIHALLAESDSVMSSTGTTGKSFLSTLSLRRATFSPKPKDKSNRISIHALLAESDAPRSRNNPVGRDISIHALLAESDHSGHFRFSRLDAISIHALLAESDSKSAQNSGALLRI